MKFGFGRKKTPSTRTIFFRLDDRLIHGQVVQGWVPYLQADEIIVVNDKIAEDPFQQKILSLSVPPHVNVKFVKEEEAEEEIRTSSHNRILVLFNDLGTMIHLARKLNVDKINLGNYHPGGETIQLSRFFSCSGEELEALKKLQSEGIRVEIKNLPGEKGRELET